MDKETIEETIASNLKTQRKNLFLSQAELSNLVGILPSSISRYERGFRAPSVFTLAAFSKCLETDLDTLVFGNIELSPAAIAKEEADANG